MYGIVFKLAENDERLIGEIDELLKKFAFEKSGFENFYVNYDDNMVNLIKATAKLELIDEFKNNVTDIKAFKIEQWSDFTNFIKKGVE